jgi:alkylhydroperoxidase family enzyme
MADILTPVQQPWSEEVAAALEPYPRRDGYLLMLFRVFANSLRFLRGKGVLNLLDRESPLSLRERELVILRTCANRDCEYEWGVHAAAFGAAAGLDEEQIRATRLQPPESPCWSETEAVLLRFVDELCERGRADGATLARFRELWDLAQQLEILALCGNYHTVSFVANSSALEPEPFAWRFPVEGRDGR